jgi:hypothetical protein
LGTTKLVGAWLHHSPMLPLVHHRSNSAVPGFLQMVAHNFVVHLLLGPWKNLLLKSFLFYFSSPTQEILPLTNLFPLKKKSYLPPRRGKFTLATVKPPLSYFLFFI